MENQQIKFGMRKNSIFSFFAYCSDGFNTYKITKTGNCQKSEDLAKPILSRFLCEIKPSFSPLVSSS